MKLSEGNVVPKSIQLLRVGQFLSEEYGKLQITEEILLSLKNNFDLKVRGYDDGKLPIDYFHENEKVAAGWIESVALSDTNQELWAEVIWTPKASQMLSDRELRYVSAEFHFDYKDNENGKKYGPTLFGAGLTNRPFVKGMEPVVKLDELNKPNISGGDKMDLEQALAKIAELEAKLKALEKPEMGEDEMKKMGEELELAKKELSDVKQQYAEEKVLAEKTGKFNAMLAEGKVVEAQRESFLGNDVIKFSELARPVNFKPNGTDQAAESVGSAQDKVLALAESQKKTISVILSENPELLKQYEQETGV